MNSGLNVVRTIRDGFAVTRYHTCPLLVTETVGHHSANVAAMCNVLEENKASRRLLMAALMHDLPEQLTGDVPYPFKAGYPEVRTLMEEAEDHFYMGNGLVFPELTYDERQILRAADMLDVLLTTFDEVKRGNFRVQRALETSFGVCGVVPLQGAPQGVIEGILGGIQREADRKGIALGQSARNASGRLGGGSL